ncbi:ly6/PLAUR domain-containing protein 2-like [Dendrobates tinctorius]|uniref:ly6/PLAUR domain-containing protein 2-like n=1 Tax=Dendrobates tinctorius TaxID=92724 RepID=UPI003CCA69F3
MNGVICLLLTTAGLQLAGSLQCFMCLTPTPADQCVIRRNCSHQQKWCKTTVYSRTSTGFPFTESRYVVRLCAEKCQQSNPNTLGITTPTFCCREDLCNTTNGTNAADGWMEAQRRYYTATTAMYSIFTVLRGTS